MKRCTLLLLFCFILILSACIQSEEDNIQGYAGIISDGKVMGYEYTILKEQDKFSWRVGYKGDITIIEESTYNEDELENFMIAVSDSKVLLAKLVISLSYFLIVAITTLITYKKNKKMLKDGFAIITVLACIAIYIAFESSFDLSTSWQNVEYYYLILTN